MLPDMPLHASTQMSVHSPEGVKFCADTGFSRVVIARECGKDTLAEITRDAPVGIEAFVHGALCVSVSGQCMLSAVIGGRSGNRGLCAQPCRLDFRGGGQNYALSLKDLSLIDRARELDAMGVAALKIEGRMRRPEYVAAAVHACRAALAGQTPDMASLRAVFSRQGFTNGYYTGSHADMRGTRTAEDARESAAVLPKLRALYDRPIRPVPVDMDFTLSPGKPAGLTVTDGQTECFVRGEIPQTARTRETGAEEAARLLSRLGGTAFTAGEIKTHIKPGLSLSASAVNAMRREACEALFLARAERNTPRYAVRLPAETAPEPRKPQKEPFYRVHCQTFEQAQAADAAAQVVLPLDIAERDFDRLRAYADRLLIEPPRLILDEAALSRSLNRVRAAGATRLLCHNPAHARLGKSMGFILHGGLSLNVANTLSAAAWAEYGLRDLTASAELRFSDIRAMRPAVPIGIAAYGRLALMLLRRCPFDRTCGNCPGALTDRTSRRFPVLCHGGFRELLNADILWLGDKKDAAVPVSFLSFLLYDESPGDVQKILRAYREGHAPPPGHTRGLYLRGTQ
jgi:putative protease